ncbi:bifunctional UDP-N-acetylglucosamine diphosphorylase/glucosamine-1-phosphate N-acetyltransferase GlmU [Brevibacillus panacihumi]|uniref:Bifunctional protein GlmU n=1 Tax=Brevibacillus panacihumi TaxID=497735 RepID=A0A3M8BZ02_9BACL|nr:bifunctional UDP-N-acetylglucosamine diphosphorylase/glucosamine-1-phosphate N-acetyltransferase GlmU [Brevibacillus panacihumi]RNB68631.1 bifunctional UDP-N-acetylglucosamine diphosphorylase/glucosamine-1-phosphate N-acetyltransferase GlmU [Brevibacillus panacihumi]
MSVHAVVLAAGKGTRMKSKLHKVVHPVCGKPMIEHIVDQLEGLSLKHLVVVVGHGADDVKKLLGERVEFVHQEAQLGTAHAVLMSAPILQEQDGVTIVLNGDTPLVRRETLEKLIEHHRGKQSAATVLTTIVANPTGYGRIIRDEDGDVRRIVEEKDATLGQKKVCEISTGIFCFDNRKLYQSLRRVENGNAQGEYYLPDVIAILQEQGNAVSAYVCEDPEEGAGVNDRVQLAHIESLLRRRIHERHMRNGVTIIDPANTYIEADVEIGQDTVIYPGSFLCGRTYIGAGSRIGPHAHVQDCLIEDEVSLSLSTVSGSVIRAKAVIGPYAYIRPGSEVGRGAKVGDFVELKKTKLGEHSKVSHLSYLGDSEIGSHVNIGCGTISVNYDGATKQKTTIEDHSFIGCNVNLIAPVTIGAGAYVAAGSTITDHVPSQALAIARERQVIKENYRQKGKQTWQS